MGFFLIRKIFDCGILRKICFLLGWFLFTMA